MELITGFTPGEGGRGGAGPQNTSRNSTGDDGLVKEDLYRFCLQWEWKYLLWHRRFSLLSFPPSLPPFNLLLIVFLLVFLESVLGLALLLEGKKRQYYIAIMRCWLPCLTLYCQSRSRSPEAGRKKKLKVVRQEHDFPPEILFVVVQHMWHTQATRRQQEGIDSSKGHRVNT